MHKDSTTQAKPKKDSGLLKDLYYLRWKTFFEQKQQELEGKASDISFLSSERVFNEDEIAGLEIKYSMRMVR